MTDPGLGADEATRLTLAMTRVTGWLGSFPAILIAVSLVAAWAMQGLIIVAVHGWQWGRFLNATYQLEVNSSTTILTFFMAFIIQNTQNRDGRAVQTKLDAIIQALELDPKLIGLEDAPERKIQEEQDRVRDAHRPPGGSL